LPGVNEGPYIFFYTYHPTLYNSGRTVEALYIFWKIRVPLCYDETNEPRKRMDHKWNIKF
jgi:hypothetical protein